jgi:endonuclease YncB( thermonuclease family)
LHIDCPETRQPFGSKAKQFLSQKVFGKSVMDVTLAKRNNRGA